MEGVFSMRLKRVRAECGRGIETREREQERMLKCVAFMNYGFVRGQDDLEHAVVLSIWSRMGAADWRGQGLVGFDIIDARTQGHVGRDDGQTRVRRC